MAYETIIVPMSYVTDEVIVPLVIQDDTPLIPIDFQSAITFIENADYYDGSYDWIPTEDTQVVQIADRIGRQNVVIEPIPSNYGKIIYNGSQLRVE